MDKEQKIAEIREALEKATPGPWFAVKVDSDSYSISNKPGYYGHCITGWGRVLQTKEDAHLIANAPEWLRFLLSELDRAEKELELFDQRGETIERQLNIIEQLQDENRKLREEREKLIEGLRMCLFNHGCWREEDYVAYIRDILKEVGVTVE